MGSNSKLVKYPRTFHLPWSPGVSDDDRMLDSIPWEGEEVVVTEKMDGENTTLYRDFLHARSLDSGYHPSRSIVKSLHASISHLIPDGWRVCGENLQARHSIFYETLPGYFLIFSIWNEAGECLDWESTVSWADTFGVKTAPVIARGRWTNEFERRLKEMKPKGFYSKEPEGYVVRLADSFHLDAFSRSIGKCVRENHVSSDQHWSTRPMVMNRLRQGEEDGSGQNAIRTHCSGGC